MTASTDDARETWSAVAAGWERHADLVARMSAPTQAWLVKHIDPQPGETVLELGAGPGDVGFEIAGRVGTDGRLISTDISQAMVDIAQRRASSFGVADATFRVADAEALDLDDASVDAVVHRFGPMLLPHPERSVAEARRVLKPNGRYAAAVWAEPGSNPWMLATGLSLIANGVELRGGDPNEPGGVFSLAEPDVFGALVRNGGLVDVTVEPVDQPATFDADELWLLASEVSGPLAVVIGELDPERSDAVRSTYFEVLAEYRSGEEYVVPTRSVCALARSPQSS